MNVQAAQIATDIVFSFIVLLMVIGVISTAMCMWYLARQNYRDR